MKKAQKPQLIIGYRIAFAALVLIAIAVQLANGMTDRHFSILNFFSFFTIQSNLFGVALFILSAYDASKKRKDSEQDLLRGAATLYLVVTAIVYSLFLSGAEVQTPLPWVNAILHFVFPLVMLVDWLIDPPKKPITIKQSLYWLLYPFIYCIYVLIRGPLAHNWYPYPFINAHEHGYVQVILNTLSITVGMILLTVAVSRLPLLVNKFKSAHK